MLQVDERTALYCKFTTRENFTCRHEECLSSTIEVFPVANGTTQTKIQQNSLSKSKLKFVS